MVAVDELVLNAQVCSLCQCTFLSTFYNTGVFVVAVIRAAIPLLPIADWHRHVTIEQQLSVPQLPSQPTQRVPRPWPHCLALDWRSIAVSLHQGQSPVWYLARHLAVRVIRGPQCHVCQHVLLSGHSEASIDGCRVGEASEHRGRRQRH